MAISYTKIPDYNQFVQSYFVDQELLNAQDVGTVLVENANTQAVMNNGEQGTNGNNTQGTQNVSYG
ncbi:MAG TPA: hypothetical protein DCM40_37320 [Maribacter sp.]|nr:hypothetical protein [Maribacter sp.]|tara:strand:+ start:172 stop:369 length:198 start_codon:yes stop_codon:yes gene_type:complete